MKLDRVTLTGADDSVNVDDLLKLSEQYPFVEWGILVHNATIATSVSEWSPRWPSQAWIIELQAKVRNWYPETMLSLHVCGRWVRELLQGRQLIPRFMFDQFNRVQLNFHAENTPCDGVGFCKALQSIGGNRQFIFQIDGQGGNEHLETLWDVADGLNIHIDTVPLFDVSGGAGVVPDVWPKPTWMANDIDYVYHGYAGGLGPDNVISELERIRAVAGTCRIWIDMETKIRSKGDSQFDLDLCHRVLQQVAPYIAK